MANNKKSWKKLRKNKKKAFFGLILTHALYLGLSVKFEHCSMRQSKVRDENVVNRASRHIGFAIEEIYSGENLEI